MIIHIIIILFNIILANPDSTNVNQGSNYFKNLKLKNMNLDPKGLLNTSSIASKGIFLTKERIDSIKIKAKNFIPQEISKHDTIIIETTKGTLKLIYYPEVAPNHCYNFKKLANSGFYDETKFHRIIKNFMIQGGDILSRDSNQNNDGQGGPGWQVDEEFSKLKHKRGTLSMARGPSPNSAGSQFFICHKDTPWLDESYTVFGEVIENIHILDLIADTPTGYTTAKLNCLSAIPENENADNWIKLQDPKTRELMYSKIPQDKTKVEYSEFMINKLRSDYPTAPVVIRKIRVINEK